MFRTENDGTGEEVLQGTPATVEENGQKPREEGHDRKYEPEEAQ